VGSAIDNPKDLVTGASDPAAIVQMADLDGSGDDGGGGGEDEATPEERKKGVRARLREQILRLPLSVRVLVCLPMWFAGWGLLSIGGLIAGGAGGPVVQMLLRFVLEAIAILTVVAVTAKTLAPDLPLKKIFNKKTISVSLLAVLAVETILLCLRLFTPDGDRTAELLENLGSVLLLGIAAVPITVKQFRKSAEKTAA